MCVRELFTVVIAECDNRFVRGDSLLLESVLLTSVHILCIYYVFVLDGATW